MKPKGGENNELIRSMRSCSLIRSAAVPSGCKRLNPDVTTGYRRIVYGLSAVTARTPRVVESVESTEISKEFTSLSGSGLIHSRV